MLLFEVAGVCESMQAYARINWNYKCAPGPFSLAVSIRPGRYAIYALCFCDFNGFLFSFIHFLVSAFLSEHLVLRSMRFHCQRGQSFWIGLSHWSVGVRYVQACRACVGS